jgi:hypothetical protein
MQLTLAGLWLIIVKVLLETKLLEFDFHQHFTFQRIYVNCVLLPWQWYET